MVADSLFRAGNYEMAIVEYERIVFRNISFAETNYALMQKASCFKEMQMYGEALKNLERVRLFLLDQDESEIYLYNVVLFSYLSDSYEKAYNALKTYPFCAKESVRDEKMYLLKILVCNEMRKWDEADFTASEWAKIYASDSVKYAENGWFSDIPHLKKIKTAKILAIVPGLGHLYAGYPWEALAGLSLNVGALAFGVYETIAKCYLTAYLGGAGMLSSTYFGTVRRAEYLVEKKNYERSRDFNDRLKVEVLNNWPD